MKTPACLTAGKPPSMTTKHQSVDVRQRLAIRQQEVLYYSAIGSPQPFTEWESNRPVTSH